MTLGGDVYRDFQQRSTAASAKAIVDELTPREREGYSLRRAIVQLVGGLGQRSGLEWEVDAELRRRSGRHVAHGNALLTHLDLLQGAAAPERSRRLLDPPLAQERDLTTSGSGGYLVAGIATAAVPARRALPVVERLGATRLTGLTGDVSLVKVATGATATWLPTEAAPTVESTPVLSVVGLTPKSVASFVEISRLLLLQSNADVVLERDLRDALNTAIDAAALAGTGASGQPTGIVNSAGVNAVTGTSLAWGGVLDFIVNAGAAGVELSGFACTPAIYKLLAAREKVTGNGGLIIDAGRIDTAPVIYSSAVPTATLIGGDFSEVVIGQWGELELQFDRFSKFQSVLVGLRAIFTIDVAVRYTSAFSVAGSIT